MAEALVSFCQLCNTWTEPENKALIDNSNIDVLSFPISISTK